MANFTSQIGSHLDPNATTLTRHLMSTLMADEVDEDGPGGELVTLLVTVQSIVKNISAAVRRAGIFTLQGAHQGGQSINVQGEEQQKLDIVANSMFINFLRNSYTCCFLVSEEMDNVVEVEPEKQGSYVVCFDPLDGSNNIECLASIGSIFAVYKRKTKLGFEPPDVTRDVLNPGRELVAAGYALYGSATVMILTTGDGVQGFVLDPTIGEFMMTQPRMRIPGPFVQYSVNESYSATWDKRIRKFVEEKKVGRDNPIPQRYIGTFIADFHRTLTYGGIFMYPNNKATPHGKLRLLYECNPSSFIIEQAGGRGTDGETDILDLKPKTIHDRCQVFLGAKEEIETLHKFLRE